MNMCQVPLWSVKLHAACIMMARHYINWMGNDLSVDFPAGCWLWGYTQPLQRFSSHLVTCLLFSGSKLNLRLTRFHFSVPSSVFLVVYVRPLSSPFPPPSCGLGISLVGVKLLLGLYSKTSFFHSQLSWHIVMEGYSRLREFLM